MDTTGKTLIFRSSVEPCPRVCQARGGERTLFARGSGKNRSPFFSRPAVGGPKGYTATSARGHSSHCLVGILPREFWTLLETQLEVGGCWSRNISEVLRSEEVSRGKCPVPLYSAPSIGGSLEINWPQKTVQKDRGTGGRRELCWG